MQPAKEAIKNDVITAIFKRRRLTRISRSRRRYLSVELLETRQLLSTYVVSNSNDGGPGSLRRAIVNSNGDTAQTNLITFDIAGTGVQTINIVSALPAITQPMTIDGTTEPGYSNSGTPLVEVNGAGAGSGIDGLMVEADDTTVQGLTIAQFSQDGIYVSASNDVIAANYIGTDPTGMSALGNGRQGVLVNGSNDTIGGSTAGSGNVIAGNGNDGLQIAGSGATGDVVQGNTIGAYGSSFETFPNGRFGILVNFQASHNLIGTNGDGVNDSVERNLISGNSSWGIEISDPGTQDNVVAGNFIGPYGGGTHADPNGGGGVLIQDGASANLIGTDGVSVDNAGEGNLISGNNGAAGVMISDAGTNLNVVAGNLIGTTALDTHPLGNAGDGVLIQAGAQSNRIGVDAGDPGAAAEPNVISGNNLSGVALSDPRTNFNTVAGNFVGTDTTVMLALGNGADGVSISNGAQSNTIGGSTALANTIRFNAQTGVVVTDNTTTGNTIRFNSIDRNSALGIDLGGDGVTPNHEPPATSGPNNWENYPIITSAGYGSTTTAGVSFASLPNGSYTIDFYASPIGDGEGNRYLGSVSVTTDANGQVNPPTAFNIPANTKPDTWISATATDQAGDTSEFSPALQLTEHSSQVTVTPFISSPAYGQSLTYTANVAPFDTGLPTPTGTIQFQVDGSPFGSTVMLVNGVATSMSTSTLPAGTHTIGAVYSGDSTYTTYTGITSQPITPASLTITADDSTKVYGNAMTFAGTEFTDSGLVNGDKVTGVTLTSAGATATATVAGSPYAIVPSAAVGTGLSNYTITYDNGTLTVNKYAFNDTIANDSQIYGTAANLATDLGTTINTGVNGESLAIAYSSTGDTASAHVNAYTITGAVSNGTGLASDYTVTLTSGTLTVNPAALTITADSTSKTYGDAVTLAGTKFTDSGLVAANGDTVTSVTLTSAGAAAAAMVGGSPYAITPSSAVGSGLGNYAITYLKGQLTVNKALLTIAAASQTMVSGQAVPSLTGSLSGFVNGDTAASLTTPPTFSTSATSGSPAGSYPIVASGAGSPNYTISFVNGTLTVIPAPATVMKVSIQEVPTGKHKVTKAIVLQFSEALDSGDAQNISTYNLVTMPQKKKQRSQKVAISKATYNAQAFTVTLITRKTLSLNPPLKLTITAAALRDALYGRPLDGNDSGQPGTNYVATLSNKGVTVNS